MLRFIAFLFGLLSLAAGALTSDLLLSASNLLPAMTSAASHAEEVDARVESPARISPESTPSTISAAEDARAVRIAPVTQAEAGTVVYVEGDMGVALRGSTVSPHVRGTPVGEEQVSRLGDGVQIYENGRVVAEVAWTHTPDGLAVDWIWAPAPYYAVTFPALGVRLTGSEDGHLLVEQAPDGAPGAAAGLIVGTQIVGVEGPSGSFPATPLTLRHALRLARSKQQGLTLHILPPGGANRQTTRIVPSRIAPKRVARSSDDR